MFRLFFLTLVFASLCGQSQAGVLRNGALTVGLRPNGAIDYVEFGGSNFFKPGAGTNVSDFGLQIGVDESTFRLNDTNIDPNIDPNTIRDRALALIASDFTYAGVQTLGRDQLHYSRIYSLVDGQNALRVTSTITNIGLGSFTVSQFDTFDPDQAFNLLAPLFPPGTMDLAWFETNNNVISLAGVRVGQASIGPASNPRGKELTMIVGSFDSRAVVASGDPLQIGSGADLNEFFRAPANAGGILADEGTHIGFRQFLNPNQSTTFTYLLAFGETPAEAQRAFTLASVPEPSSVAVFGVLGLCGFFLRRRAKQ